MVEINISKVDSILEEYKERHGTLIPILQESQEYYGYLPEPVMERIADKLNISSAEVYGVATFYTQFRFQPMGKNVIKVCHGTACHVGDAGILDIALETKLGIKAGETTEDGLFTILPVACLGCCSLAPVVMINDKTYGKLTGEKLSKIINQYIEQG